MKIIPDKDSHLEHHGFKFVKDRYKDYKCIISGNTELYGIFTLSMAYNGYWYTRG